MTIKQKSRRVNRAWLITWVSVGDHAKRKDGKEVVALLSSRMGAERVRELVEKLYYVLRYTPWDMVNSISEKPYTQDPAKFIDRHGVPWQGAVHCGDNPFLMARMVRNFQVIVNDDGTEQLNWDEIPVTKPPPL